MGTCRPADDLSSDLVDGFRHAGTYVAKSLLAPARRSPDRTGEQAYIAVARRRGDRIAILHVAAHESVGGTGVVAPCPQLGDERTWLRRAARSESDPKRTSAPKSERKCIDTRGNPTKLLEGENIVSLRQSQESVVVKIASFLSSSSILLCISLAPGASAQQITGTPSAPSATMTLDGKQLPPEPPRG
jgi:hypothetical protein